MTLLRIDSSIQGPNSASSALADRVVDAFLAERPSETVRRRHLAQDPIPATAWPDAVRAGSIDPSQRNEAEHAALTEALAVADELRHANVAVFAMPLYNWGVSQHVKSWIDLALVGGGPATALLDGTPTVLVTTRGGAYGPGTPKEGWDHNIDYLRRVLVDVWGANLHIVEREFTLVGINPALEQFTDVAANMKESAEELAMQAGRTLAA